jgi:Tfp pilus assembly protein PilV
VTARLGFSLVEILISVVIFSGVILVLAGLAYQVARRTTRSTDQVLIMSRLQAKVDQLTVIPYDSLAGEAGCDNVVQGRVTVTSCVTVTSGVQNRSTVTIKVYSSIPGTDTTTLSLERARVRRGIPLR